jgi:hypothetical protein
MARGSKQPAYADPRPPWARPGFVLSAILIGLVVVIGIGFALAKGGGGDTGEPGAIPMATGSAGDQEDPSYANAPSPRQVAALPTGVPSAAPTGVKWQLLGQVAVPVSASAGPYRVTETVATGYAHTPTGALMAVAQLQVRASLTSGRPIWEPTISGQFVAGPQRDQLLSAMRAAPDERPAPGELAQISGFLFQAYSDDTAVIALGFTGPSDADYFVTATVQWRGGDWRMVPPPGAAWLSLSGTSADLPGVVKWGAV